MRTGIIGGMATLLLVGVIVRADEEKVPLDKVPKAVLDAVKRVPCPTPTPSSRPALSTKPRPEKQQHRFP